MYETAEIRGNRLLGQRKVIQKPVVVRSVVETIPPLEQSGFVARLAILMPCLGIFNYWCPTAIEIAKIAGPSKQMWLLYFLLISVNFVGLLYVSRLFLRRVRDISGHKTGLLGRTAIRFALLSPLLGVQLLLLTALAPGGDRDRLSWGKRYGLLFICLMLVHFLYLAWQVKNGHLARARNTAPSASQTHGTLPSENGLAGFLWLRPQVPVLGLEKEDVLLQEAVDTASVPVLWRKKVDTATVHFSPYLNPGLKVVVTSVRDYLRLRTLYLLTEDADASVCKQAVGTYLGVKVEDCFLRAYRRLNKATPFVTPMMALYFDSQRRSAKKPQAMKTTALQASAGQSTDANVAQPSLDSDGIRNALTEGLLRVENMIEILEPDHPRRTIRHVAAPNGLIFFFGNVEVPFMELVREIQTLILNRQLGRSIAEQLPKIRSAIEKSQDVLSESETQALLGKVSELTLRVDRLPKVDIKLTAIFSKVLNKAEAEPGSGAAPDKASSAGVEDVQSMAGHPSSGHTSRKGEVTENSSEQVPSLESSVRPEVKADAAAAAVVSPPTDHR